MTAGALVAVLTVVTDAATEQHLDRTLKSLRGQTDTRWQWCVVVSPSAPAGCVERVRTLVAGESRAGGGVRGDPRAGWVGGPGHDPRQGAIWSPGWMAVDLLDASTIAMVRARLAFADWVYTDEGAVDDEGSVVEFWAQAGLRPGMLRSQPYALRFAALPLAVVAELGGLRPRFGAAAWYDLVLRVAAASDRPPTWQVRSTCTEVEAPARPMSTGTRATGAPRSPHRWKPPGEQVEVSPVELGEHPMGQRVRRRLQRIPKISLVIPTRASSSMIHGFPRCHAVEFVRSLWTAERYPNLELIVVSTTR